LRRALAVLNCEGRVEGGVKTGCGGDFNGLRIWGDRKKDRDVK